MPNREELGAFFENKKVDSVNSAKQMLSELLIDTDVNGLVTLDSDGSIALTNKKEYFESILVKNPTLGDTNGLGDIFRAGFSHYLVSQLLVSNHNTKELNVGNGLNYATRLSHSLLKWKGMDKKISAVQ